MDENEVIEPNEHTENDVNRLNAQINVMQEQITNLTSQVTELNDRNIELNELNIKLTNQLKVDEKTTEPERDVLADVIKEFTKGVIN